LDDYWVNGRVIFLSVPLTASLEQQVLPRLQKTGGIKQKVTHAFSLSSINGEILAQAD